MKARIVKVEKKDDITKLTLTGDLPFAETFYDNEEYKEFRSRVLKLIEISKLKHLIGLEFDWELVSGKPYPVELILPENPIFVDIHEPMDIFEGLLPQSVLKSLKFGDYNFHGIINHERGLVSIERKEAGDLVSSCASGELSFEVNKMAEGAKAIILLKEGFLTATSTGHCRTQSRVHKVSWSFVWNHIHTLQEENGLIVDESPNLYFTPKRIKEIYDRYQDPEHKSNKSVRSFSSSLSIPEQVLTKFEGYGEQTAKKVLEKFGTLRNYFNASQEERETIPDIGHVKSKVIDKILDKPFQFDRDKK